MNIPLPAIWNLWPLENTPIQVLMAYFTSDSRRPGTAASCKLAGHLAFSFKSLEAGAFNSSMLGSNLSSAAWPQSLSYVIQKMGLQPPMLEWSHREE